MMSNSRKQKQQIVKKKIKQILLNVREEKQHIENQLAKNDNKIKEYCLEYEQLRHETDFTQLSKNQITILKSIIAGLEQTGINPVEVLGQPVSVLMDKKMRDGKYNRLNTQQVVIIQESIMGNLREEIRKAKEKGKGK